MRATERQLIYGSSGVGKSTCWADIAAAIHKAGNKHGVKFHVVDSDNNWDRMYDEGYGYLEDDGIVVPYYPYGFEELLEVSQEVRAKVVKGRDWIINDMATGWYSDAQAYFAQRVYGVDYADYMVQVQAEIREYKAQLAARGEKGGHEKDFGGFAGGTWAMIREVYYRAELPLTQKSGCNVITIVEEKQTGNWDDAKTKAKYGRVGGVKPDGHKGLEHRHHTVLRMTRVSDDERELTYVKDRGREARWAKKGHSGRTITVDADRGYYKQYMLGIAKKLA